jgi:hypothetical protein
MREETPQRRRGRLIGGMDWRRAKHPPQDYLPRSGTEFKDTMQQLAGSAPSAADAVSGQVHPRVGPARRHRGRTSHHPGRRQSVDRRPPGAAMTTSMTPDPHHRTLGVAGAGGGADDVHGHLVWCLRSGSQSREHIRLRLWSGLLYRRLTAQIGLDARNSTFEGRPGAVTGRGRFTVTAHRQRKGTALIRRLTVPSRVAVDGGGDQRRHAQPLLR